MKKIILIIITFVIVVFITGCSDKNNNIYNDRLLLTKVLYNEVVMTSEEYELQEINKSEKLSNSFAYSSLKIINSFSFNAKLDFNMEPYLENYTIGDEINVFIILLQFYKQDYKDISIYQKMIIFSYEDQLIGFLSPISGSSPNTLNEIRNDDVNMVAKYSFGSYFFLTNNEIIKYYEKGEKLYDFIYEEDDKGTISLYVECNNEKLNCDVNKDSKELLTEDCVSSLIDLTTIEKVIVEAKIVSLENISSKIIKISSSEYVSLNSVKFKLGIINSSGEFINESELKVGDIIEVYFYKRYGNYEPINIVVDNIYIKS